MQRYESDRAGCASKSVHLHRLLSFPGMLETWKSFVSLTMVGTWRQVAVAAVGIDLDGGIGNRDYRPASSVDLRDHYQLGIGQLVLDLRDTDLPKGDVPVKMDIGVGDAEVIVPDNVCVATDAEVGMGNVRFFGHDHGGVDVDYEDLSEAAPTTTRLLLKANVGIGQLRVYDSRGEFYDDFDPLDESHPRQAACSA